MRYFVVVSYDEYDDAGVAAYITKEELVHLEPMKEFAKRGYFVGKAIKTVGHAPDIEEDFAVLDVEEIEKCEGCFADLIVNGDGEVMVRFWDAVWDDVSIIDIPNSYLEEVCSTM